jgi:hypothetical protein
MCAPVWTKGTRGRTSVDAQAFIQPDSDQIAAVGGLCVHSLTLIVANSYLSSSSSAASPPPTPGLFPDLLLTPVVLSSSTCSEGGAAEGHAQESDSIQVAQGSFDGKRRGRRKVLHPRKYGCQFTRYECHLTVSLHGAVEHVNVTRGFLQGREQGSALRWVSVEAGSEGGKEGQRRGGRCDGGAVAVLIAAGVQLQ